MNNWITKIWLPFLLVAFAAALYLEYGSVESFDPQIEKRPARIAVPQTRSLSPSNQSVQKTITNRLNSLAVGELYGSLEELVADQEDEGFVKIGYFGKSWPAKVVEIQLDDDAVSFVRKNGVKHNYTNFDGYRMKMVRLISDGRETIVVFRSRQKRR